MKRVTRYIFVSVIVLTLLIGLAQATAKPLVGYCDQVCCVGSLCQNGSSYCYCPGTTELTHCGDYCLGYCGTGICF
jgi:hypothetical protein